MGKRVSFKADTVSGDPINVYGEITENGAHVSTWTRDANLGMYRVERFGPDGLTARTLKHVMTVGDLA